eukprot:6187530-Pleurochrysis_carterae.AAC.2
MVTANMVMINATASAFPAATFTSGRLYYLYYFTTLLIKEPPFTTLLIRYSYPFIPIIIIIICIIVIAMCMSPSLGLFALI